jgi:hypothetical protein
MIDEANAYEEGLGAFHEQDFNRAYQILLRFAEAGSAEAQCIIGNMCELGLGRPVDEDEAVRWYLRASEQGHGVASNNLGTIALKRGDQKEARGWYQKSAEQGFPHSPKI